MSDELKIIDHQDVDSKIREMALLGTAIVQAQYVEFAIGAIAAHAAHLPSAQADRRLRNLTPQAFLHASPGEIKITFGQFVDAFGDAFMIKTDDLAKFVKDRNLVAHDYVRRFKMGANRQEDPIPFLLNFIEEAQYWRAVLQGFIHGLMLAAARKEGREAEVVTTPKNQADLNAFHRHVDAYLSERIVSAGRTTTADIPGV